VEINDQTTKPVSLTPEQWAQVLGIMTQGSQLLCSQFAPQEGGLEAVRNFSTLATSLIAEIKEQTK